MQNVHCEWNLNQNKCNNGDLAICLLVLGAKVGTKNDEKVEGERERERVREGGKGAAGKVKSYEQRRVATSPEKQHVAFSRC